ncbi:class I SAM-dependent methyltransferase [Virgibacillus flavescens]|uniref:class I SAM-dependent methyltransferase n=1 Tax=Virgibacillus flavescens TaxID=1611422 RepID=UPI003D326FC5
MKKDNLFDYYLSEKDKPFKGWDFSYVSETGRMQSGLISWSYGSFVRPFVQKSNAMLDMGTGGGEFLSRMQPFPKETYATEAYLPNVSVAKERLGPIGVKVVQIEEDSDLPFEDNQFDLIMNKHEAYSPAEIRRIISENGIFVTQQVGGLNDAEINDRLGAPVNDEFSHWNLEFAVGELINHSFEVTYKLEEYPVERFYDVGALVYYLQAIPWQIPDFNVNKYCDKLYTIHQEILQVGYFEVKQHRFMLKARPI